MDLALDDIISQQKKGRGGGGRRGGGGARRGGGGGGGRRSGGGGRGAGGALFTRVIFLKIGCRFSVKKETIRAVFDKRNRHKKYVFE